MEIRKADAQDEAALVKLMHKLWPDASLIELSAEIRLGLRSGKMHYFLASNNLPIGFCQLSFRHDYVPGAASSPTAFLEGIYVDEPVRRQEIATRLVEAAASYARSQGCNELASDTEIDNRGSQRFHEQIGFQEVERTVHYMKKLSRD